MSKEPGNKNDAKAGSGGAPGGGGGLQDLATLTNSLRFEREKNEVLLNEVVALEDELVNRRLEDFEGVIGEATREFWREQLLSNREAAMAALEELRQVKAAGTGGTRRPLHNRHETRPAARRGYAGQESAQEAGSDNTAAKIRNRAHELCKTERIPFSTAFRRAEQEIVGE